MDTQSQPNADGRQDDAQKRLVAEMIMRGYWEVLGIAEQQRMLQRRLGLAALRRVKPSRIAQALDTDAPELLKGLAATLRPLMLEITPDWVAQTIGKCEVLYVDAIELIAEGKMRPLRRRKMPPRTPEAMPCEAEFYAAIGSAVEIRLKGADKFFIEYLDGPTAGRVVSLRHEGDQYTMVIPAEVDIFVTVNLTTQGDQK